VAHLVPPDYPAGTSPGEVLVFEALRAQGAGPGWTVLHSLHIPEHVRQVEGEADFVALMPGLGVLCVEVKSHLKADYVNGAWYLGDRAGPDYRGPFRQAEMAARSIKRKVVSALPPASKVLFWPAVIFTHCMPSVTASTGDWHAWQLLTSADLDREPLDRLLEGVLYRARQHVAGAERAAWFDVSSPRPTGADCDHIRRVLRPDVHFLPSTSSIRRRRKEEIRRFTGEQLEVIEGLDGVNERALIEGPAGTGKTVLAFEEARRASALGSRTALLCFNQQLAAHLRAEAMQLHLTGVEISTLHSLLRRVAGDGGTPSASDGEYWSRTLPDKALGALIDDDPPFEFLIIDEAQDLIADAYLDVMDALLAGELSGGCWRMFADFERQAIYSDVTADPVGAIVSRSKDVARYKLRRNCRNTPRVAEYVVRLGGLDPGYSRVLRPDGGPEGTPRTSFYSSPGDQARLLRETLSELQCTGELSAQDIVVLSPTVESCASVLSETGTGPPLIPLPGRRAGATSFGTVAGFKGLDAPAVILTDIEEVGTERSQRLFYVGVSRATDRLRVLARDGLQGRVAQLVTRGLNDARVH
jgi:hypothetical protein